MLITCPECQFARNINASSIPSKAQLATCPRCKTRFRFRILHEEEQLIVERVDDIPVTESVKEELHAAAEAHAEKAASMQKTSGDEAQMQSIDEDDYIESSMVAAMQEEIEELLKSEDAANNASDEEAVDDEAVEGSVAEEVQKDSLATEDKSDDEVLEEVSSDSAEYAFTVNFDDSENSPAEDNDEISADESKEEKPKTLVKRSASAQALRERGAVSVDNMDAEEEAVKRYEQVQESSGMEAASAHIVPDSEEETDIWDAIAAMGDEHECTESFAPGCGAQVHIIPWEDGRLDISGRVISTFGSLLGHPRSFWRGVNAKPKLLLPMLFYVFMSVVACAAIAGWLQILIANWSAFYGAVHSAMPEQQLLPEIFSWPNFAPNVLAMICGGVFLLPIILGGVTHIGAKLLGGTLAPFSTGVKTVAYSTGAFFWLLFPVLGIIVSLIYFPLLYVNGVRTGYNVSLFKTVVLIVIVTLVLIALVLVAIAAGVTFM